MKSRFGWIAIGILAVALVVAGALRDRSPSNPTERAQAIAKTVRCPVCGGETVAESRVSVAVAIRELIARELAAGKTDDEVRAVIETQYEGTQLVPPSRGFASTVWVLPVVALGLGAFALGSSFRRWRQDLADEDLAESDLAGETR